MPEVSVFKCFYLGVFSIVAWCVMDTFGEMTCSTKYRLEGSMTRLCANFVLRDIVSALLGDSILSDPLNMKMSIRPDS